MNGLAASAGSLGFLAVALGAFGAHGLEGRLTEEAKDWWETATLYLLVHSVAALAMAQWPAPRATTAGWAFVLGASVFAGTLYAMALGAPRFLGAITPIGGVGLLVGWGLVISAAIGAKSLDKRYVKDKDGDNP